MLIPLIIFIFYNVKIVFKKWGNKELLLLLLLLSRSLRVPTYSNMSYGTHGSVFLDDVTNHVAILTSLLPPTLLISKAASAETSHVTKSNFFISLVSCLFRRLRVPSYSKMLAD